MLQFVKTQALGNDFLLVEKTAGVPADYSDLARRICDRHFGVGADGLILWELQDQHARIRIFNRDGGEAECSGNGLRCVAAYLMESGRWRNNVIPIETASGLYTLRRAGKLFEADMGTPHLAPSEIPFLAPTSVSQVVNYPLDIGGREIAITACSTGNPHCSVFTDKLDETIISTVGPTLEKHPAFPKRTNVEFIRVLTRSEIEVGFWERGVGLTLASGTGSCGATVASILNGKTDRHVTVRTKAGHLDVTWPEGGRLKLTSTANVVAEGTYWEA